MSYTIGPNSLRKVCPTLTEAHAKTLAVELGDAMQRFGITQPAACAHFISQCAHESGEFRYLRELWTPGRPMAWQAGYWKRSDLQGPGPLYPQLGYLTRGAGYIQTTGRVNFKAAAKRLGIRYTTLLARAGQPRYAALMAAIWWSEHLPRDLNGWSVEKVTRTVNGGVNGLAERQHYHQRAQAVAKFLTPRPV